MQKNKTRHQLLGGLRERAEGLENISIMRYAGMVVRGGLTELLWIAMSQLQELRFNTMGATGTAVADVLPEPETKSSFTEILEKICILQQ